MTERPSAYPDNADIFARKANGRIERASLSFVAKLGILDEMRSRLEPMVRARRYLRHPERPSDQQHEDSTPARTVVDRLRKEPDETIDYSDIPPLGEDFFRTAEWLMPAGKSEVSLRLDKDVLDFFRDSGKGYQSRINAVLRAYMISMLGQAKRSKDRV